MDYSIGYKNAKRFISQFNNITYPEFDYYSVTDLDLFSSLENLDFEEIGHKLTEIEQALPAIKRIFAKPIIHLIDEDVLVPVEAVRLINNKTMSYASNHSELWDNLTEDGIKPRKLLTNNYTDNYVIYENVVFSRAVDYALNYCKHFIRILSDLVYSNKKLEIDLLERENHFSYYLALGKLQTGYIRSFAEYADPTLRLISRMEYIYSVLKARLKRPVYAKCHKVRGKMKFRKTNILAMHKDYRKIYRFLKTVYSNEIADIKEDIDQSDYLSYCKCLTVFAAGHFNFQMDTNKKIDFKKLNIDFTFKGYKLNISDTKVDKYPALLLTFNKEKEYKILLVPSTTEIKINSDIEAYILSPEFDNNNTFVSIHNIDSFRRIQQIILKGMVYSNEKFDVCPFCGGSLVDEGGLYFCEKCRTEIKKEHCDTTDKDYLSTNIRNYRIKRFGQQGKTGLLQKRFIEGIMHFRNITRTTADLALICPCCNKVHSKETKS